MNLITETQVTPIKPNNGLVGFASFVYNNSIYLGSVGIYTRPKGGYRLTYPTKKIGSNNINIFNPISREVGELIENEVIKKFNEILEVHESCERY